MPERWKTANDTIPSGYRPPQPAEDAGHSVQYICEVDFCDGTETPKASIGDVRVFEGDEGTTEAFFPVTLSCPSDQEISVAWETKDGTAVAGEDYLPASGTITFTPGETSHHASVAITNDTIGETLGRPHPGTDHVAVNRLDPCQ